MWTGWSIMGHWHHLGLAVGITALVGCGTPTPDAPVSGHTSGSADPVVSLSAGGASRTGLTAYESARQAPTQTSPLGPSAQHASTPEARITDATRGTSPARTMPAPRPPPLQRTHRYPTSAPMPTRRSEEARQRWFAEMQESLRAPQFGSRRWNSGRSSQRATRSIRRPSHSWMMKTRRCGHRRNNYGSSNFHGKQGPRRREA